MVRENILVCNVDRVNFMLDAHKAGGAFGE